MEQKMDRMMKYCETTTINHPVSNRYPAQIESINTIFSNEGFKQGIFGEERAMNLDKIEIELCKGKCSLQPTMDFAIGLSKEGKNCQILLVELKLNVNVPSNVTKKEIDDKIRHSVEVLSHTPQIYTEKYILFRKEKIAVAKSYMSRLYGKPPKPLLQVKSPEEFKSDFF